MWTVSSSKRLMNTDIRAGSCLSAVMTCSFYFGFIEKLYAYRFEWIIVEVKLLNVRDMFIHIKGKVSKEVPF